MFGVSIHANKANCDAMSAIKQSMFKLHICASPKPQYLRNKHIMIIKYRNNTVTLNIYLLHTYQKNEKDNVLKKAKTEIVYVAKTEIVT